MRRTQHSIFTINLLAVFVSLITIGCTNTTVSSVQASPPAKSQESIVPATESIPVNKSDDSKSPSQQEETGSEHSPKDPPTTTVDRSEKSTIAQAQPVLNGTGFMLPSKNIHCMFRTPSDRSSRMTLEDSFLRCEILSSLKPMPPRPKDGACDNADWGSGLVLSYRKKPWVLCASDSVQSPDHPVLQYGQTWKSKGFTCQSTTDGLTCTNPKGNGFFLNREEWQTF